MIFVWVSLGFCIGFIAGGLMVITKQVNEEVEALPEPEKM